jgi:hypothetical protein
MIQSRIFSNACPQSQSPLIVDDLSAQLAPLDRYGPSNLGPPLAHALGALADASRKALHAFARRTEHAPAPAALDENR